MSDTLLRFGVFVLGLGFDFFVWFGLSWVFFWWGLLVVFLLLFLGERKKYGANRCVGLCSDFCDEHGQCTTAFTGMRDCLVALRVLQPWHVGSLSGCTYSGPVTLPLVSGTEL